MPETHVEPQHLENLHLRIDDAIAQHPHLKGMAIKHEEDSTEIRLTGTVDSFFLKQMAQEAIRSVDARPIRNQIEVTW